MKFETKMLTALMKFRNELMKNTNFLMLPTYDERRIKAACSETKKPRRGRGNNVAVSNRCPNATSSSPKAFYLILII